MVRKAKRQRVQSRPAKRRRGPVRPSAAPGAGQPLAQSAIELPDAQVEDALQTGEHPELLQDLFGSAGYAELRSLAREASARSVRGGERVLIVPGIMGSKLGFRIAPLIQDVLWIGPIAIAGGRLIKLQLEDPTDPGEVKALGVLLFAYLALKLRLRIAGYDAAFSPFDWRLGILGLGEKLAAEIDADGGRTTHVVAHSMGGLVARAALRKNPKNLGRVITLGTPNYGSYSPVQAFRGVHSVVQKIAALDLLHDQADLAQIFGRFPGLLEMIPKRALRPSNLFDLKSWPKKGVCPDQKLLTAASAAQDALPEPTDDFYLIVGVNNQTVVNARLDENGNEFVYDYSTEGDGTVPLDLARVAGRPAWATDVAHGDMPNSETIARAVDNLLVGPQTSALPKLEERLATAPRRGITRSQSDRDLTPQHALPIPTKRAARKPEAALRTAPPPSLRDQRSLVSEFAAPRDAGGMVGLALRSGAAKDAVAGVEPGLLRNYVVTRQRRQRLDINLVCGSITEVHADAYVVGVFRSVTPDGAAAAIDRQLDGMLHDLVTRRMISGEVGEVSAFPIGGHRLRTEAVMLAGLGTIATYSDASLELVGESIMRTALLTRIDDFAIVPLGGGSGSNAGIAFAKLLHGFLGALETVPDGRLRGFTVCEVNPERFNDLRQTLYGLLRTDMFGEIEITLNEQQLPAPEGTRGVGLAPVAETIYLLVREEIVGQQASVVASVLTAGGKAAIVQERHEINDSSLTDLARKLAKSGIAADKMAEFGTQLAQMVLPPKINELLGQELGATDGKARPLVVVHDAALSRVPWETLQIANASPALNGGLTHRYDGGNISVAKWREEGARTKGLNVLVVINPTGDLDGADDEGTRVQELFGHVPGSISSRCTGRRRHGASCCAASSRANMTSSTTPDMHSSIRITAAAAASSVPAARCSRAPTSRLCRCFRRWSSSTHARLRASVTVRNWPSRRRARPALPNPSWPAASPTISALTGPSVTKPQRCLPRLSTRSCSLARRWARA